WPFLREWGQRLDPDFGMWNGERLCRRFGGEASGPAEAHPAFAVIDVQIPGGTGQGQQGIAQQQRAEVVVRRRQWERVQRVGITPAAKLVARTQQDVAQRVADAGMQRVGYDHVDHLQQQVVLGGRRGEFHEGVAAVADDRDVLRWLY